MTKELSMRYAGKGPKARFGGNGGKLCVEGDFVTVAEIAERLGITSDQVSGRKHKILKRGQSLTWERLRATVKPQRADAPTD